MHCMQWEENLCTKIRKWKKIKKWMKHSKDQVDQRFSEIKRFFTSVRFELEHSNDA